MYLLRLPELFLGSKNAPIPLAVVCSGDKSVQYIGRKIRIRKLFTSEDDCIPELEMNFSDMDNSSSSANEEKILELFNEYGTQRATRRKTLNTKEVLASLDAIIHDLEFEVKKLCV